MSGQDLSKIEEIFHAALELSAESRAEFLDDKCGVGTQLRREVESLIEFDAHSTEFIDESPAALAAEMFSGRKENGSPVGKMIGHYRVVKLLGFGGMGEVYLAEDTRLGRKVALKILPEVFVRNKDRMERFSLEARSASALNHPNILTIHEIGKVDGTRFIATEFVDGKTLKELLASGKLALATSVDIAMQMASALEDAHAAGIVHRDIKPDNVMVRANGLVKILDFGVAKFLGAGIGDIGASPSEVNGSGKTLPGMIIGTADYMSPEQARGGAIDRRSDIFSFGAVFYEMLSGRKAFSGESALDTIGAILHKEPSRLSDIVPDVPHAIEAVVLKCLNKSANERYQNVGEILSDLRLEKRRLDIHEIANSLSPEYGKDQVLSATAAKANEHSTNALAPSESVSDLPAAATSRSMSEPVGRSSKRNLRFAVAGMLLTLILASSGVVGYRYLTAKKQIGSIAVMPFVNASGDSSVEYLSDGMTENLIRSLSSISGLSIKARSTVFTYKGKEASPKTIGRELNVETVLLGRVEQSETDLKLSLELVEASTQDVLWSANYSRKMSELVVLQREIARDVSDRLRPELSLLEQKRVAKNYYTSPEAQQLYLKGRFHWNKRNVRDFEKAVQYFDQASQKDPNYALAYTGAADTYALMPLYGSYKPTEYFPKAKQAAMRALELDPNLAEAHASLGYIANTYDYDWDGAEEHFKTALRLNPNYATAHQWYAEHLAFRGRLDEALTEISIALELDPFSLVINRMMGNILVFWKRHDEAISQLNRTVELYPESPIVRFNLGEALASKGMYQEAVEQYLIGFKLDGRKNYEIRRYENAFKLKGWQGFWMEYLATLITLEKAIAGTSDEMYFDNESLAYAYAAVGNNEKAIEYLRKAYETREPSLITIRMSEVYDGLRYDPRYQELVTKIGLAP